MLYIDQPVGAGFSYGNRTVNTSQEAAEDIWTFMQILLHDSRYSKYKENNLTIWTESCVVGYLGSISNKIGAETTWQESSVSVFDAFAATGDWMRNFRPDLEAVINAGSKSLVSKVRTIIYDGDTDYIVNFDGVEAMLRTFDSAPWQLYTLINASLQVDALNRTFTLLYRRQKFQTYTVAGQKAGQFKNASFFSYIRIYGAGHEVPAYKFGDLSYGQAAFQLFLQIIDNQSLSNAAKLYAPRRLSLTAFVVSYHIYWLC